jgi:hypothetical protein
MVAALLGESAFAEENDAEGGVSRSMFCQSLSAATVNGFDRKGGHISMQMQKGDWYFRYETSSAGSHTPIVESIAAVTV